jgi:hypothetical protein
MSPDIAQRLSGLIDAMRLDPRMDRVRTELALCFALAGGAYTSNERRPLAAEWRRGARRDRPRVPHGTREAATVGPPHERGRPRVGGSVMARVICLACVRARREGRPWGCGCEWDRVLP